MKLTIEEFEEVVSEVKDSVLASLPVEVPFTLKVKELSKSHWCALYRGGTLIRSGRAIIWINSLFPEQVSEVEGGLILDKSDLIYSVRRNLLDTISHELIHAIQEAVWFAENRMLVGDYFDEAEAESLGVSLARGDSIENFPLIQKYIKYYCE